MSQDIEIILKKIINEAESALSSEKDEKSRLAWTRQAIKATETYILYQKQREIEQRVENIERIIKGIDNAMYSVSRRIE